MLSVAEIRNVKFSKSMSGYKQDEVDVLLDKVEADYIQYDRLVKEYSQKIQELTAQVEEYKNAQSSIQNVLLSAQQLADKIVNDAKDKSEEIIANAESSISIITAKEKELSTTFELKAKDRKDELEKQLADMVSQAEKKAESITKAAEDSVARQQLLFDKLKVEISSFKSAITAKYKEHLEILSVIPDSVPMDPKRMAEAVIAEFEKAPDANEFISSEPETTTFPVVDEGELADIAAEEEPEGFSVEGIDFGDENTEE